MNKLTKQLLSLGLSVVTVAGMVSPVLADDEVPTTEPTEEITEVSEQPTGVVEETTQQEEAASNEVEAQAATKTITLRVTQDGKETTRSFDVDSSATDEDVINYIVANCVPAGYRIDGKGAASSLYNVSGNEWVMTLVKNEVAQSTAKTYNLKILKVNNGHSYLDYSEYSIEYTRFTYDSSKTNLCIEDYIERNYCPKGYYTMNGPNGLVPSPGYEIQQLDENTWFMLAIPNETLNATQSQEYYKVDYYNGNENVGTQVLYSKPNQSSFSRDDINTLPAGYVFAKNAKEFKVDKVDENGTKHIAVQVEKGSERIPVSISFYGMKDGKNVLLKEVNVYKDEFDLENNYIMQKSLTKYLPARYTFAKDIWSNTSNQYATEQYYASKIYMSYMLDELSTVRQTGETKNTVALSDEKANMILASSVSNDMKKKYEEAIQAQKDVTFESKVTESNLDSTAVNKLNAFAKSSGSKAVSTFDITLSMLIDGKDEGSIAETSAPLTFNIPIPQELKKAGRKFYVLRYHDGKVDELPVDDNGNFTTDKFSVYMLVYEDVATPTTPETKPEVKPATKPSTGSTTTTTDTKKDNTVKKDVKKNKKVNTSTKTSSTLFTGLLGVSIVGLGAVEVLRRRNK
jgi:hypothetical protein